MGEPLVFKADQLTLFGGATPRKPVGHPGSRGGKGYFDAHGNWQYGVRTPTEEPTPQYQAATERARHASARFATAQEAYRSRRIDDTAFLAARAAHQASMAEFDAAYAMEQEGPPLSESDYRWLKLDREAFDLHRRIVEGGERSQDNYRREAELLTAKRAIQPSDRLYHQSMIEGLDGHRDVLDRVLETARAYYDPPAPAAPAEASPETTLCGRCHGQGRIHVASGRNRTFQEECARCGGSGRVLAKAALIFAKAPKPPPKAPPAGAPIERAPEGAHVLGTTKRGKPVYASGAETAGYNDADHAEAGALHARAYFHHAKKGDLHRDTAAGDGRWQRAEEHHQESGRHQKLADHHHELARLHLTAAGKAEHLEVDVSGDQPAATKRPADDNARAEARDLLARRTHHNHPGGMSDQDRAAYGGAR